MAKRGKTAISKSDVVVRKLLARLIHRAPNYADGVAMEMAKLLGVPVSKQVIYGFCSLHKDLHRFPAGWLSAFCKAVGNYALLHLLAKQCGYAVISIEELKVLAFGKKVLAAKKAESLLVGGSL